MKQNNTIKEPFLNISTRIVAKCKEIKGQYGLGEVDDFENMKELDDLIETIFNKKIKFEEGRGFTNYKGEFINIDLRFLLEKLIKFDLVAVDKDGVCRITESMEDIILGHGIKINSSFFKKSKKILKNRDFLSEIAAESIKESNPTLYNSFTKYHLDPYKTIENAKRLVRERQTANEPIDIDEIKKELIKIFENKETPLYQSMAESLFNKQFTPSTYLFTTAKEDFYEVFKQMLLIRNLKIKNLNLYLRDEDNSPTIILGESENAKKFNAFQLCLMVHSGVNKKIVCKFVEEIEIDWKEVEKLNQRDCEIFFMNSSKKEYFEKLSEHNFTSRINSIFSKSLIDDQDISSLAKIKLSQLIESYEKYARSARMVPFISVGKGEVLCEKDYPREFFHKEGEFNAFQVYLMCKSGVQQDKIREFTKMNYINWDAIVEPGSKTMSELHKELYNFNRPYSVMRKALFKTLDDQEIAYISQLRFKDLICAYDCVKNVCINGYIKNKDKKLISGRSDFNAFQLHIMMQKKLQTNKRTRNKLAANVNGKIIDFILNNEINWDAKFVDKKSMSEMYPDMYEYDIYYPIIEKALAQGITEREAEVISKCNFKNLIVLYKDILRRSKEKRQIPYFRYYSPKPIENNDFTLPLEKQYGFPISFDRASNFNAFQVYLMNVSDVDKNVIRDFIKDSVINWDAQLPNGEKISEEYPDFYEIDKLYFVMKSFYLEGYQNENDSNLAYLSQVRFDELYCVYRREFGEGKFPYVFARKFSDTQINEDDSNENKIALGGYRLDQKEGDFNALQMYAMRNSGVTDELIHDFIEENHINWNAGFSPLEEMRHLFPDLYEYNNEIIIDRLLKPEPISSYDILYIAKTDLKDLMRSYSNLKDNSRIKEPFYISQKIGGLDYELSGLNFTDLLVSDQQADKFDTFQLCMMMDCFDGILYRIELMRSANAEQDKMNEYFEELDKIAYKIDSFIQNTHINWEEKISDQKTVMQRYSYADFADKFPDQEDMFNKYPHLFKDRSNILIKINNSKDLILLMKKVITNIEDIVKEYENEDEKREDEKKERIEREAKIINDFINKNPIDWDRKTSEVFNTSVSGETISESYQSICKKYPVFVPISECKNKQDKQFDKANEAKSLVPSPSVAIVNQKESHLPLSEQELNNTFNLI